MYVWNIFCIVYFFQKFCFYFQRSFNASWLSYLSIINDDEIEFYEFIKKLEHAYFDPEHLRRFHGF